MKTNKHLPTNKKLTTTENGDKTVNTLTDKQEQFVDKILIEGMTPKDAYLAVYPKVSKESAVSAASRLLKRDDIKARLFVISDQVKRLNQVPLHYLTTKVKKLLERCEEEKNYKYMLECVDILMKAGGYYTQQKVITTVNLKDQDISFGDFNPDENKIIDMTSSDYNEIEPESEDIDTDDEG